MYHLTAAAAQNQKQFSCSLLVVRPVKNSKEVSNLCAQYAMTNKHIEAKGLTFTEAKAKDEAAAPKAED